MGQPSEIFLEVKKVSGELESIPIAGQCVQVIPGSLTI